MKKLIAILAFSAMVAGVQAQNVYDNTTNLVGFLITGQEFERGDGITLAGTDRYVTNIDLMVHGLGGAFTADATVRFFSGGDTATTTDPGGMLWQSATFAGMAFASGLATYSFAVPLVLVPDEMTWTLQLAQTNIPAGQALGSRFVAPPTTGTSNDWVWTRDTNTGMWTNNVFGVGAGNNSYGAAISASPVPEPASMIALGAGLAALLARRRRKKA